MVPHGAKRQIPIRQGRTALQPLGVGLPPSNYTALALRLSFLVTDGFAFDVWGGTSFIHDIYDNFSISA